MNPRAFEILENLKLPYPHSYSLDEAISSERNNFYLRFSRNSKFESYVIDKDELIKKECQLHKLIASNDLIKIEDSFSSIAGSAIYINNDGVYGEYVEGHIISLLRRGICKLRFFINLQKEVFVKESFQGFEAYQQKGGYTWMPYGQKKSEFSRFIQFLTSNIDISSRDLLLEILITNNEIIFCDAKNPMMSMCWNGIKQIFKPSNYSNINLISSESSGETSFQVDGLDIDMAGSEPLAENILIANGAILSHYVTRNIERFKKIIYINRKDK